MIDCFAFLMCIGTEVSGNLKFALRQCIEILGNEVIHDMKERQHVAVFGRALAEDLTLQCLRYMYRILFTLFIEAKPELDYAPMKAQTTNPVIPSRACGRFVNRHRATSKSTRMATS